MVATTLENWFTREDNSGGKKLDKIVHTELGRKIWDIKYKIDESDSPEEHRVLYNQLIDLIDENRLSRQYLAAKPKSLLPRSLKEKMKLIVNSALSTDENGAAIYPEQIDIARALGFLTQANPCQNLSFSYQRGLEALAKAMPDFEGVFPSTIEEMRCDVGLARKNVAAEQRVCTTGRKYSARVDEQTCQIMDRLRPLLSQIREKWANDKGEDEGFVLFIDYYLLNQNYTKQDLRHIAKIGAGSIDRYLQRVKGELAVLMGINAEDVKLPDHRLIRRARKREINVQ